MPAAKPKPNRAQRRGYTRPSRNTLLVFTDPDYEGLEVRTRRVSLGQVLEFAEIADGISADTTSMTADDVAGTRRLLSMFANVIVDWNLEAPVDDANPDGPTVPVPVTLEGLLSQDFDFSMTLFNTWMGAVGGGISAPLDATSPDGGLSAVPPLPMEPLSESPGS